MLMHMSRPRRRPTREETRQRLFAGAAAVFVERGIAGTSIEDICDAAGFSRGAFYSNFEAKDDLVLEMLEAHFEATLAEMERLYEASSDPTDFLRSMESDARRRHGPLDIDDGGLLNLELTLYALRNPGNRARLVDAQRRMHDLNKRFVERIADQLGRTYPVSTDDVAALITAIDVGLNLHAIIDPESYRPQQFSETMVMLHELWLRDGSDTQAGELAP
jgi:AcrR family transcriptional regulator